MRRPAIGPCAAVRAIPGIVLFFAWLLLIILAIILLAWIVHWAGGGIAHIRIGHFILNIGFT
jgi:hypothetical protein